MIKLFVTDLDGCISYPFKTPNWGAIHKIREYNLQSRSNEWVPPITLCTGRPLPYAEAVAQWLDVRIPFVFESAGLFHWEGNRIETAFDNLNGQLEPIRRLKEWLEKEIVPHYPNVVVEFGKIMDAGVVCPDQEVIHQIHEKIRQKVERDFEGLEIHATDVSVNTLLSGNNKLRGLKLLGKFLGIGLDEMAFIGDTGGDAVALKHVKLPFAPSNAFQVAKEQAEVLAGETADAVLEAYERVIRYNERTFLGNAQ